MGTALPPTTVDPQRTASLFKSRNPSTVNRIGQAVQRFEGMLWNEVAQAMSAVHLGPSELGSAGQTYERMMWRRIATQDFGQTDQRLTAAVLRQLGQRPATPEPSSGADATSRSAGYTGLPALDGVINRNAAVMPPSLESMVLAAGSSTGAAAPAAGSDVHAPSSSPDARSWVQGIWGAIRKAADALGVPPKGLLAQAALETGWGRRAHGHNLFGVKARGGGTSFSAMTHEFVDGVYHEVHASFASYGSVGHAIGDFVQLLRHVHPTAVGQATVAGYARALQASGYATDPRYAAKIEAVARSPRMKDLLRAVEDWGGAANK